MLTSSFRRLARSALAAMASLGLLLAGSAPSAGAANGVIRGKVDLPPAPPRVERRP